MKQEFIRVEDCVISDLDVPAGSGGINREGDTYGELRRRPIIPEVMRGVTDPVVRRWAGNAMPETARDS